MISPANGNTLNAKKHPRYLIELIASILNPTHTAHTMRNKLEINWFENIGFEISPLPSKKVYRMSLSMVFRV